MMQSRINHWRKTVNEIDYERMQEDAATGQAIAANLKAILDDWNVENVAQLNRTIYKSTECGARLSVQLHDGTWRHNGNLDGIDNGNVQALLLSSIVEGGDTDVTADPISLLNYMDEGDEKRLIADFDKTLDWVDGEACSLWHEANDEDESTQEAS
jgi:hypothetical protein